jgi:enamine deaminase RidA (YjgF/YER057c/UK114 family)
MGIVAGKLELVPGGIEAEARQALAHVKTIAEAHGFTLRDVVKCTVMLADMADWPRFNQIYRGVFTAPYPARSAFGASGLALGGRVEVECIAARTPTSGPGTPR